MGESSVTLYRKFLLCKIEIKIELLKLVKFSHFFYEKLICEENHQNIIILHIKATIFNPILIIQNPTLFLRFKQ